MKRSITPDISESNISILTQQEYDDVQRRCVAVFYRQCSERSVGLHVEPVTVQPSVRDTQRHAVVCCQISTLAPC